jgi:hypothetical protein
MLETAREVHRSRGTAPAMLVPWTADSTGWAEMSLMSSRKQMYGIEITTPASGGSACFLGLNQNQCLTRDRLR